VYNTIICRLFVSIVPHIRGDIMQDSLSEFFQSAITTLIGIIISLIGFWTTFVRNMVTKKEVIELIHTHSAYVQDRTFIMERLTVNKEALATVSLALQKNTEVMTELKIQIATLGKTLEALEYRIERN
jgi:hypothetical protein